MDLGEILGGTSDSMPALDQLIDNSNLPKPARAIVTLSSGITFDATVQYAGTLAGERKYRVVAEVDWATAGVERIDVDRWPPDVFMTLKIPDEWTDEQATAFGHSIEWGVAGQDYRPRKMLREDMIGRDYMNNLGGGNRTFES